MAGIDLATLNSATKYPSIPTYHFLGDRGILAEDATTFARDVILTEKVDGCLVRDTRISMADGTRTALNRIRVGDEVLGVDESGCIAVTAVTRTFDNGPAAEWMKIKGERTNGGRGSSFFAVTCTPNHRFWLPQQHRYRAAEELAVGDRILTIRSELKLTPCQSSVLLGKLLGDGHLAWSAAGSASVVWGHRAEDEEYVRWTLRALGDIGSPTGRTLTSGYGREIKTGRSVFHPSIAQRFGSMRSPSGKIIPEWVAEALDPISLAFWYMDDGSLSAWPGQEDRASIATNGFSERDCKVLLRGLARLGVDGTLMEDKRGYHTIRLGTDAAEQLFLLVAPYVPAVMQRKLPKRYRGHQGWLPPVGNGFRDLLVEQVISEIERNHEGTSSRRYDIETGTHNFFANGVLVHNSNGRIVLLPDGDWFVGSREELLTARGDRIANPALGIVEVLKPLAKRVRAAAGVGDRMVVFFLEVYGHKVGSAAKQYTGDGRVGYRMFDMALVDTAVLDWPLGQISAWREGGGQPFLAESALQREAKEQGIPLVPRLATVAGSALPQGVAEMREYIGKLLPGTNVALDERAGGRAEGVVLRSSDRSVIAKARFEDYERTLRRR